MKKKILGGIAVFVIAVVAAWNVNLNSQKSDLSDISLANVEALASGESGGQPMDCYCYIQYNNDGRPKTDQTYCGNCQAIVCTYWAGESGCMR
jgi:hypothetical protein